MPVEAQPVLPVGGVGGGSTPRSAMSSAASAANPRKRQRTLVSCSECHRRKQKCDRKWPCGNCTSRSATHLCQYGRKVQKDANPFRTASSSTPRDIESPHTEDDAGEAEDESEKDYENLVITARNSASEFGYTIGVLNTSLNVLAKLDIGCSNPIQQARTFRFSHPSDLTSYNNLIRLVPARPFTNLLVQVFFTEVNSLYGTLHQPTFNRTLEEWWNMCNKVGDNSASQRAAGVESAGSDPYITNDLHFFPSLLLQVLSLAIQLLPHEHDEYMNQIIFGVCETLHDFSVRLSNASCELAVLLGGTGITSLNRVIQAFLRCSWLKNEGRIHEAWHYLGNAIRIAQEQSLHLEHGSRGPGVCARGVGRGVQPTGPHSMGERFQMMWYTEMEKRVWILMYTWDRYMSVLLSRPTMINDSQCTVSMPVDCEYPEDFTSSGPTPRGVLDPPSCLTHRILDYRVAQLINEVVEFSQPSKDGSTPDFVRLDALHAKMLAFTESFPPEFSITDRNPHLDSVCQFLPLRAALLKSTFFSVIVALHRPFLFERDASRKEIIGAALKILECQDIIVRLMEQHHHRVYAISFFTFDPCILLSAIVITNCRNLDENTLEEALTAIRAGLRRLRLLGVRVRLAQKGAVVLRVLLRRVEAVVEKMRSRPNENEGGDIMVEETGGTPGASQKTTAIKSPPSLGVEETTGLAAVGTNITGDRRSPQPRLEQYRQRETHVQSSTGSSGIQPRIPLSTHPDSASFPFNRNSPHATHQQHQPQVPIPTAVPSPWGGPLQTHTTPSLPPATPGSAEPLIPSGGASLLDFTHPLSTSGYGTGGETFPGYFDMPMPTLPMHMGLNVPGGSGASRMAQTEFEENWAAALGFEDGLWQNLLGIFG